MNEQLIQLLDNVGLNWKVRTENVISESGIQIPNQKVIIRDDTNVPLSIRSDEYHPFQNYELIELLDKVSQRSGLEIKNGGSFKDGARVFIQLKSNNLNLGTDRVEGYLTGINSFDGSTSLAFGPSNITISCQNKFFAAFRELETKVRHTKNMNIRIDEICRRLDNALVEEQKVFNNIVRFTETRFDDEIQDRVTRKLFNLKKEINLKDENAVSSLTRNKLSRFYIDLNGELKQKGENLWGLFSGVTKYTTHSISKDDKSDEKMFNVYGKRELEIFNELVEFVS
jgi:phage/plasmid-like protein (TIGR03299 family)